MSSVAQLIIGLALATSGGLPAQSAPAPTIVLGHPTATASHAVSEIAAVHELPDGRLLVIDVERIERTMRLVDFSRNTVSKVGRRGDGPGEYRDPTTLFPIAGDSVLVYDGLGPRILIVSPSGIIARTSVVELRPAAPSVRRLRSHPQAIDAHGRIYYSFDALSGDRSRGTAFTSEGGVIRAAQDQSGEMLMTSLAVRGAGQPLVPRSNYTPWPLRDAWAARKDGLVARVIASTYEVSWHRDGRETGRTGRLPHRPIDVTSADRAALINELQAQPVLSAGSGGAAPARNPIVEYLREHPEMFPRTKPPVGSVLPNVLFDPAGTLWIAREHATRDNQLRYDLIEEGEGMVGLAVLPPRTHVIGFGRGTIYLARRDADDLIWIERYAGPVRRRRGTH